LCAWQSQARIHYRPEQDDWVVLRHRDVARLIKDFRLLRSSHVLNAVREKPTPSDPIQQMIQENARFWELSLPNIDPPQHGPMRKILKTSLNRHFMADVEDYATTISAKLANGLPTGECDLVAGYTRPLMNGMIGHLYGVPEALTTELGQSALVLAQGHDVASDPRAKARAQQALLRLYAYVHSHADQLGTIGGAFVRAIIDGFRAQGLGPAELHAQLVLLYAVAQTTTQDLIGSAMLHLLRRPEVRDAVAADLTLAPGLITETLRYEPPVQYVARRPHEPIELFGQNIAAGQRVILMIAAAHHDPMVFDAPDAFDIWRDSRADQILAFGGGIHRCIGMHVAPVIAGIAVTQLLKLHPGIQLSENTPPRWHRQFLLRGLETLPAIIKGRSEG